MPTPRGVQWAAGDGSVFISAVWHIIDMSGRKQSNTPVFLKKWRGIPSQESSTDSL